MTKKTENQPTEKNRLLGYLTYLPAGEKSRHGVRIGPVFSTSRADCKNVVPESIPMDLIRGIQRGQVGSFFIWDRKDEAGA